MNKKRLVIIFSILFFAGVFYWVEFSPWSSKALASCNGGYGTFDMKEYSKESVSEVLSHTSEEGFRIYNRYLIGDFIFIIAFGLLQLLIIKGIYTKNGLSKVKIIAYAIIIVRGLFDFIENCMLELIVNGYPKISANEIMIASTATKFKLICIGGFMVSVLFGLVAWAFQCVLKKKCDIV